jgi:Flp pilus assembly protein TadG
MKILGNFKIPALKGAATARLFRRLCKDQSGVALVEFSMIAPVLVASVLAMSDGANYLMAQNAMHAGVSAGAQYIMGGGSDLSATQSVTLAAWSGATSAATVSAAKSCTCAGAGADCNSLCPDQTTPQAFVTITAQDNFRGMVSSNTISTSQQVRIR